MTHCLRRAKTKTMYIRKTQSHHPYVSECCKANFSSLYKKFEWSLQFRTSGNKMMLSIHECIKYANSYNTKLSSTKYADPKHQTRRITGVPRENTRTYKPEGLCKKAIPIRRVPRSNIFFLSLPKCELQLVAMDACTLLIGLCLYEYKRFCIQFSKFSVSQLF